VIKDCFKKEVKLLEAEMGWMVNYFHNQSLSCKALSNAADNDRGWACSAVKESACDRPTLIFPDFSRFFLIF
jgi:hypothetical protein